MHGAGAALRHAAAEFGIFQAQIVPQHIEQRGIGVGPDRMGSKLRVPNR